MGPEDPTIRKQTRPQIISVIKIPKPIGNNETILPKQPGSYEPFLRSETPIHEEYIPKPIVNNPAKYQYIPKPVLKVPARETKKEVVPPKITSKKSDRKKNNDKCIPTELIPKDSLYWLPILNRTKRPDQNDRTFFYYTMKDKQRVKIFSHKSGKIEVIRRGVTVTIREPDT